MGYYKEVGFAARIKECGVPDIIVLIYQLDYVSLENAASICEDSTAMQRAACDVVRSCKGSHSPRNAMNALHEVSSQLDSGTTQKLPINFATAHLHIHDYKLATKVKGCAEPDLLVILNRGWATLSEIEAVCTEHPTIQQEATKLMWNRNNSHEALKLSDAIHQVKNGPETSK